ncbi:MAG: glycoside hydrolase family 16 protein [Rhizomicrobium sp.]
MAGRGLSKSPAGVPAGVSGTNWARKSDWNFGTAEANNVRRFGDWLKAGWYMDPTPTFLNKECETYRTTDGSDANPNFQPFGDHCDIVAIWNGGPILSALGNGSISSLMVRYDIPDGPSGGPSAIGYYELTAKIPSAGGAWPAWWTIGHPPGIGRSQRWGPEIDIFEFTNTDTKTLWSTLHKGAPPTSYCFMKRGTTPPDGDPPAMARSPATTYTGTAPWNCGSLAYAPGGDFSQDYHRYGLKIDSSYHISIWVDDVETGLFAAEQYCDDRGRPVSVQLIVNLAVGNGSDPVGSIDRIGFGGPNNRGPANKFRLSIRNIQVWSA